MIPVTLWVLFKQKLKQTSYVEKTFSNTTYKSSNSFDPLFDSFKYSL